MIALYTENNNNFKYNKQHIQFKGEIDTIWSWNCRPEKVGSGHHIYKALLYYTTMHIGFVQRVFDIINSTCGKDPLHKLCK